MNKQLFTHLGWALVAVSAFVLGSKFVAEQSTAASDSKKKTTSVTINSGNSPNSSGATSRKKNTSSENESTESDPPLSEADLIALGEEMRAARGPIGRRLIFAEILEQLTPENAELLRQYIAHLPPSSSEYRDFHYAWGSMAGKDAVVFGIGTEGDDMGPAIAGWANANPTNAIAWLKNLDMESNPAYENLLAHPRLTVDGLTSHFSRSLVSGLVDTDPDLATEFVLERYESGDKSAHRMMHAIVGAQFQTGDPSKATNWIESIPESSLKNTTMHRVAGQIASENPQQALTWLQGTPENESRSHGIGATLHTWAGKNPEEAAEYISAMPASSDKDAAAYGYATRVVHDNPAAAIDWASSIQDPESRTSALVDTGRVYMRKAPEAARQWLENSNLPQEAIQRITGK